MQIKQADFDAMVRHYALLDMTSREVEAWVYCNAGELETILGPDLYMALLAADYSSDLDLIDIFASYCQERAPGLFVSQPSNTETHSNTFDTSAIISGELAKWPSKARMANVLRDAGLNIYVGRYSIRVEDCAHFVFQEYGGDLGDPCIDAQADCVNTMMREGKLVSMALSKARLVHRFEVYDYQDEMVGYLNHGWPLLDGT